MENVYDIKCNTKMDKLRISKGGYIHKISRQIKKNKFISLVLGSFVFLSGVNFYLIYNFIKILEKI